MNAKQRGAVLLAMCLAACNPVATASPEQIASAIAAEAAFRTQTATALPSGTPPQGNTPTPSSTSPSRSALTATAEFALSGPHGDGVYRVGEQIAIGTWRSIPDKHPYCYWARLKYDGIVLGSHYGPPGGEMNVHEGDYEIEFDGCGVWVYMGPTN
jgi:hypothetical protein